MINSKPTFVTNKKIIGEIESDLSASNFQNKIVMTEAADPGYDWLFSRSIAGLITCYGGANSHMVIRANELGLPAAIGIGKQKFQDILKYKRIILACEDKIISKI